MTKSDLENLNLIYENMGRVFNNIKKDENDFNTIIMPFMEEVSEKKPQNLISQLNAIPEAVEVIETLKRIRDTIFKWQDPRSNQNSRNQQQVESLSRWTRKTGNNLINDIMRSVQQINQLIPSIPDPRLNMRLKKIVLILAKMKNIA
jgi:hypothetical protein